MNIIYKINAVNQFKCLFTKFLADASKLMPIHRKRHPKTRTICEEEEEEFIYHKYTYTSNFRLIHVSDGLPEKQ